MATTTWALADVEYDVSDGFCHTAHWTATRVDGDYNSYRYGSVSLTKPSSLITRPSNDGWTPLIEDALILDISEKKTPTQGSFVPAS